MTKLTRAAFMDAVNDWLREEGWSVGMERQSLACDLWSRFAKRGLVEERRQHGWYWASYGDEWHPFYWNGEQFLDPGPMDDPPPYVGPFIPEPDFEPDEC